MRTLKVSDDVYEQLKCLVVDPFDDTPEIVIGRLIEIVNKAKSRWSPFNEDEEVPEEPRSRRNEFREEESVVVL
jgi:predicted CopG family antitoxin